MNKADLAILVAAPKGKGPPVKAGPPMKGGGPMKGPPKSDDTVERTYFQQAIDAFRNGDDAAAITSAIQGIRECVKKELAEGY